MNPHGVTPRGFLSPQRLPSEWRWRHVEKPFEPLQKCTYASLTTSPIGMRSINTWTTKSSSGSKCDSTKHIILARCCNVSGSSERLRARRRHEPATIFGRQRSIIESLLLIWAAVEAAGWELHPLTNTLTRRAQRLSPRKYLEPMLICVLLARQGRLKRPAQRFGVDLPSTGQVVLGRLMSSFLYSCNMQ